MSPCMGLRMETMGAGFIFLWVYIDKEVCLLVYRTIKNLRDNQGKMPLFLFCLFSQIMLKLVSIFLLIYPFLNNPSVRGEFNSKSVLGHVRIKTGRADTRAGKERSVQGTHVQMKGFLYHINLFRPHYFDADNRCRSCCIVSTVLLQCFYRVRLQTSYLRPVCDLRDVCDLREFVC